MLKNLLLCALLMALPGCQLLRAPVPKPGAQPTTGVQWLYGSAESAASHHMSWDAIADFAETRAKSRPAQSVVLDATGAFVPCGNRPLAAVFDADETLIWNLGVQEYWARRNLAFDIPSWLAWEKSGAGKAAATPGALEALARIRAAGVDVIVNTNRTDSNAAGTQATLKAAGLGDFEHKKALWLRGDTPGGSGKDGRRMKISQTHCVILLAGDQLGDIADLFNDDTLGARARKVRTESAAFAPLWGNGWFVFANPVYGPSLAGEMDDIFTDETRWAPN